MGIFSFINDLLYKDRYVCSVCGEVFACDELYDEVITGHTGICLECIGSLPWIETSLRFYCEHEPQTEIFAPLYYRDDVKTLMKDFKFEGKREIASVLAYVINYRLDAAGININQRYDMIVPVPLSEERMIERGYNQSALVAEKLARYFGIEYCENAVYRTRNTKKQSLAVSKEDRYVNVRGAFMADEEKVKGKRVLIFDDIYTYGYTMSECVKAVKAAGAVKTGGIAAALAKSGSRMLI